MQSCVKTIKLEHFIENLDPLKITNIFLNFEHFLYTNIFWKTRRYYSHFFLWKTQTVIEKNTNIFWNLGGTVAIFIIEFVNISFKSTNIFPVLNFFLNANSLWNSLKIEKTEHFMNFEQIWNEKNSWTFFQNASKKFKFWHFFEIWTNFKILIFF